MYRLRACVSIARAIRHFRGRKMYMFRVFINPKLFLLSRGLTRADSLTLSGIKALARFA